MLSLKGVEIDLDNDTMLMCVIHHVDYKKVLDGFVYNKIDWEERNKGEFGLWYDLTDENDNENHNLLINEIKSNCTFY